MVVFSSSTRPSKISIEPTRLTINLETDHDDHIECLMILLV